MNVLMVGDTVRMPGAAARGAARHSRPVRLRRDRRAPRGRHQLDGGDARRRARDGSRGAPDRGVRRGRAPPQRARRPHGRARADGAHRARPRDRAGDRAARVPARLRRRAARGGRRADRRPEALRRPPAAEERARARRHPAGAEGRRGRRRDRAGAALAGRARERRAHRRRRAAHVRAPEGAHPGDVPLATARWPRR